MMCITIVCPRSCALVALAALAALSTVQACKAQEPSEEQRQAFRAAKTVRIVVEQTYEQAPEIRLPFEEVTRRLLAYTQLTAVGAPSETADMTVTIRARGRARSRSYTATDYSLVSQQLYTGASLQGDVAAVVESYPPLSRSFRREVEPPRTINDAQVPKYRRPADAPFVEAFASAAPESFLWTLEEFLSELYGRRTVAGAFKDNHTYVATIGLGALMKLDPPEAAATCVEALREPRAETDVNNIFTCLWSLAHQRPESLEALLPIANDSDSTVRSAAVYALGQIEDPRAAEAVVAAMRDPQDTVRYYSIRSLAHGRVPVEQSRRTDLLVGALKDRSAQVRREAASALRYGDWRAIEPLIATLKDPDQSVRYLAAEALQSQTRQGFGQDQKAWQRWWKENKRVYEH